VVPPEPQARRLPKHAAGVSVGPAKHVGLHGPARALRFAPDMLAGPGFVDGAGRPAGLLDPGGAKYRLRAGGVFVVAGTDPCKLRRLRPSDHPDTVSKPPNPKISGTNRSIHARAVQQPLHREAPGLVLHGDEAALKREEQVLCAGVGAHAVGGAGHLVRELVAPG